MSRSQVEKPKSTRSAYGVALAAILLRTATHMILPLLVLGSPGGRAEPIPSARIRVLDGDTIEIDRTRPTVRLVGFNAPETDRARCLQERTVGEAAAARLSALVSGGGLDLSIVPCSCPPGTQGTTSCNYGRACAVLRSGGKDVGQILIAEGLAVPFRCHENSLSANASAVVQWRGLARCGYVALRSRISIRRRSLTSP